jgi:ABC-type multidrug transport system fused ATPase/permease subunit
MAAPVRKKPPQRRKTTNRGNKPDYERELSTLFQILGNENQILMRTDQKAFTLLSILGVFMVFFIVHFLKVQMTWFIFLFVLVYFVAALITIINLILVIVPRVRTEKAQEEEESNPLFFAGISQYKSAGGYARTSQNNSSRPRTNYLSIRKASLLLGMINTYKYKHLRNAITAFIVAISAELSIIMAMAWARSLPF